MKYLKMDTVFIEGLELETLIGVYEFERKAKQRIIVDLIMQGDLSQAAQSDNVKDTIDYGAVANCLAQICDMASYQLLEALAEEMATTILDKFAITTLTLKINKPDILNNVSAVGIQITRQAQGNA
ncbi:dihydroneopterin aldolase [Glaciecola petra]|uniref:7,8-dihydroneopterin aldolase n=1 Tax=Glaciecola petra TaxID=3075602 RepID=A0ABU2ZLX2_9ALTE|nr:dihydroneopterin aldolase [Aestuariibacter sp. P117]MDT0593406.1 dihydroneopterin aldolase [Aestuariibacter sp. P117]